MSNVFSRGGAHSPQSLEFLYIVISPVILVGRCCGYMTAASGIFNVLLSHFPPFPRSSVKFATSVQTGAA